MGLDVMSDVSQAFCGKKIANKHLLKKLKRAAISDALPLEAARLASRSRV